MNGFHDPYSAKPAYGQGIQDIMNKLMQMIMMSKMFPQQGQERTGQTQAPPMQRGAGANILAQAPQGGQQPGMPPQQPMTPQGGQALGGLQGIDPMMLQKLLPMMMGMMGQPGMGMGR